MDLAIDEPRGPLVHVLDVMPHHRHERAGRRDDAQLLVDLSGGLDGRLAEAHVTRGARIEAPRPHVLVRRALLEHDLERAAGTLPHDPAEEREMPVAVAVDGSARLRHAGGVSCRIMNLERLGIRHHFPERSAVVSQRA